MNFYNLFIKLKDFCSWRNVLGNKIFLNLSWQC